MEQSKSNWLSIEKFKELSFSQNVTISNQSSFELRWPIESHRYLYDRCVDTHSPRGVFAAARNSRYSYRRTRRRSIFRSAGKSAPFLLSQSCNFEPRDGTNFNEDDGAAQRSNRGSERNDEDDKKKNKKLFTDVSYTYLEY